MSALDDLPPDQRAVLQMILQRGRSYDEIAALLSIDPSAVRQRALDAFDALAPTEVLPGPESALVTDYLLRQLPAKVAEQVYSYLEASDSDRVWAEAVAARIEPLASEGLPEIPVGAPLGADDWPAGGLEPDSDPPVVEAAPPPVVEPAAVEASTRPLERGPEPEPRRERPREDHPSSRRGGAILLGTIAALVVAAIVIVIATSGGSPKHHAATTQRRSGTPTPTRTVSTTGTTSATAPATTTPQILSQLNLTSPTGASATIGVAQVIREAGVVGVVIDAQGVPANTSHNAYAVWLYNSAGSHKFVGFVRNLVGKNGRLSAEGELPAGAASYHRLLITLETQQKPSAPGEVILSGPFREHP